MNECFLTHANSKNEIRQSKQKKNVGSEAWVLKEVKRAVPNQNTILINIIWQYFIRYGKSTMKFKEQKTKLIWTIEKWKIITLPVIHYKIIKIACTKYLKTRRWDCYFHILNMVCNLHITHLYVNKSILNSAKKNVYAHEACVLQLNDHCHDQKQWLKQNDNTLVTITR